MVVEEFYKHVLHLPRRQAEIFTVWSGGIIALALLFLTIRSIVRRIVRAYETARRWCLDTAAALKDWWRTLSEGDIAIVALAGGIAAFMLLSLLI